jgi:bla regulator protein BlaR1
MIPQFLSDLATSFGLALGNHIWQSTLFACAIALLTLIFRRNRARIRYGLWLAASLKFLFPFSILVAIGGHLMSPRPPSLPKLNLYTTMQQASEPFGQPVISQHVPSATAANPTHLLPLLLGVWTFGLLVVLAIWCVRWRRVSTSIRAAVPLHQGREVETLRRLERVGKISRPIDVRLSSTSLEPGIFGIACPVLVWPQGISDRLDDAHLEAVLAHELRHVRRRDNLAAALHMFVEAVFWFHPLVWWLGARLIAERERACDEEVLELGSDCQVYAESILRICEFCVGSPLSCVSGVTGADLKKRIARIMSARTARKLDLGRKLLLGVAAILAVAAPILAGAFRATPGRTSTQAPQTTAGTRAFATVSIAPSKSPAYKVILMFGPNSFRSSAPLQQVIRAAYGVEDDRIIGAPDWLNSEKYDFEAREDSSGDNDPRKLSFDQNVSEEARMLQQVLAARLKLALHRETRDLSVYALVLAQGGPKFHESQPGDIYPNGFKGPDGIARPGGIHFENSVESGGNYFGFGNEMVAQGIPLGALAWHLRAFLHRTIVDETGLSGTYDFIFQVPSLPPIEASGRILSAHLDQQLGLKLEARTVPMEVLVIDHVERPAASQVQSTAPAPPAFHIVSIKANKSGNESSNMNVSLLPGDASAPTGGLLSGTNVSLISYIYFAYKLTGSQFQLLLPTLPNWLISEKFDVQVQATGNPTNDQLRLVMQGALADRFHLAAHYETRQLPVYALVLGKPGETGPQLRAHSDDPVCSTAPPMSEAGPPHPEMVAGGFPADCGHIEALPSSRLREGARKISMTLLASYLPMAGNLDRPVLDQTGLTGTYDFSFEHSPQRVDRANPHGEKPFPEFVRDLNDQLGLRLEPQTSSTDVFVLDHVERPRSEAAGIR